MSVTWLRPPYRALVVGINEYDAPSTLIPPLQGAVPDARAIYELLTQELGMATTDIVLLTSPTASDSAKATRSAIMEGLENFLGASPSGSEVLFYFSGYGSYTRLAPDIRFGDQQGETLVPADARTGNILDILDRELRLIRAALFQKGIRLTFIADTCFGGDVMRGEPERRIGALFGRMLGEAHSPARSLTTLLDGTITSDQLQTLYDQNDDETYALISACLPTQQSYETWIEGQERGIMTNALLKSLNSVNAPITYAELGKLLPAFVSTRLLERQLPNVNGNIERGIFGTALPFREDPLFAIQAVDPNGELDIRAGLIAGLENGSRLMGYSDWSLTTTIGEWEVIEATAHRAKAVAITPMVTPQVGQPLRLISRSTTPTVYFDPTARKIQAAWYEDKKVGRPALIETTDKGSATYIVTTDTADYVARRRDGFQHPFLKKAQQDPRAIYDLARQLNRVATYETFVALQPRPDEAWALPPLNDPAGVGLTVEQLDWNNNATALPLSWIGTLPAKARLRITLENKTDRDIWVAVYLLDEPYFLTERLYPNDSNFHLLPGASRAVTWNNNEWGGGLLPLKLFVSSQPIQASDMPKFPCGTQDTNR